MSNERIDFPVDVPVTVDASDVNTLTASLQAADAQVQQLQQHVVQLVNALTGLSFKSFDRMAGSAGGVEAFAGIDPKVDAAIGQLQQRIAQLQSTPLPSSGGTTPLPNIASAPLPSSGGTPTPGVPVQPTGPGYVQGPAAQQLTQLQQQYYQTQLAQQPQTQRLTQLQLQNAQNQANQSTQTQVLSNPGGGPPSSYSNTGNWNTLLSNLATQTGALTTILPFYSGGNTPAQNSANQVASQALGGGGPGGNRVSIPGLSWLTSSLTQVAGANTEADVVGPAVSAGGSALSGLVRAFPFLAGFAAVGGAALGTQALSATAMTREQELIFGVQGEANRVPENALGAGAGASGSMMRGIYQAGVDYYTSPSDATSAAVQLGQGGMRRGDVLSNLRNALAFSTITGETLQTSTDLTSTLSVQGGRSPQQIDQIYQNLYLAAEKTGQPMSKLVDSLQTVEKATGGAARSLYDVAGISAVQKILGPAVNVGSMAGAMSASGYDAIGMAASYGMSVDKFMAIQGSPARLFDAAATRIQGVYGRTASPNGTEIAGTEGLLKNLLGQDFTNVSPEVQQQIARIYLNAKPGQAQDLAKQIASLTGSTSFQAQGKTVADQTVSQVQQKLVDAETLLAQKVLDLTAAVNANTAAINPLTPIAGSHGSTAGAPPSGLSGGEMAAGFGQGIANAFTGGRAYPNFGAAPKGNPNQQWTQQQWRAWIAQDPVNHMPNDSFTGSMWNSYNAALSGMGLGPSTGTIRVPGHSGTDTLGQGLASMYYQAGSQYGVNPYLLMSQGAYESDFHSTARSSAGAMGIAQFMPDTISMFEGQKGSPIYGLKTMYDKSGATKTGYFNPYNPAQEIPLQAYYMQQLIAQNGGNVAAAMNQYSGYTPGYGSAVTGNAQHIELDINVGGKMTVVDLSGNSIGTGSISPTKKTVSTNKPPAGHRTYGPGRGGEGGGGGKYSGWSPT